MFYYFSFKGIVKGILLCISVLTVVHLLFTYGNLHHTKLSNQGAHYLTYDTTLLVSSTQRTMPNLNVSDERQYTCKGCMERRYKFLISSPNVCKNVSKENNHTLDLLILITTTYKHKDRRHGIRDSWTKVTKRNTHPRVRYAFLMGFTSNKDVEELRKENQIYGDIIVQDFKEAYKNLTLKTLMALEWSKEYCPHFRFLLKTDDDMYVHVKNIITLVKKTNPTDSIIGACSQKSYPIRNSRSKYYASVLQYPFRNYPGFCSGTGYVMPRKVAFDVLAKSPSIPFFHLEDVYIAICATKLGYKLKRVGGFSPGKFKFDKVKCGSYGSTTMFTSHYVGPKELVQIWEKCGQYLE